jgi:hypothetical protein
MRYSNEIIRATLEKSIKWINSGKFQGGIEDDALIQIFFLALKGLNCDTKHIDISQERALLRFLEEHKDDIKDPHVIEFIRQRTAIL